MILLLSTYGDETARAVYDVLVSHAESPELMYLTDFELVSYVGWSHRQIGGVTETILRLRERSFSACEITAVFNRLSYFSQRNFSNFNEPDRQYVSSEMFALLLSWLNSLRCLVVNPVGTRDLGGGNRSLLGWLHLAGRAGLPVRQAKFTTNARLVTQQSFTAYQVPVGATFSQAAFFTPFAKGLAGQNPALLLQDVMPETRRLLVIGGAVYGELPEMFESCLRLAQLSKTHLLECVFSRSDDSWLLSAVNSLPLLSAIEAAAVAELLAYPHRLKQRSRK